MLFSVVLVIVVCQYICLALPQRITFTISWVSPTDIWSIFFIFFFSGIYLLVLLYPMGGKKQTNKQPLLFTGRTQPLGKIHLLSYARPHVSLSKSKYHQPLTSCNLLQVKQIPLQTKKRPVVPVTIRNVYIHS